MVKPQISFSDPHVAQKSVREAFRDDQAEHGMNQAQGNDAAVAPEHFAEEQAPEKAANRQDRAGNMNRSE